MRFMSLFSGIGGMDLGLERAGMECVVQVESDEYARGVLARHWPHVPRYDDVVGFPPVVEPVDLICGGPPCQPLSWAGRRKAEADERWMWDEYIRIVREVRPRWVLVENVLGLLSAGHVRGSAFGTVLGDLAAAGYDAEWQSIPAAAVGARHIRNRVWLVAYTNSAGLEGRVFDPERTRELLAGSRREAEQGVWSPERRVQRLAHGVPRRVDRIRCLGNACVPQLVEVIGRRIMECHAGNNAASSAEGVESEHASPLGPEGEGHEEVSAGRSSSHGGGVERTGWEW